MGYPEIIHKVYREPWLIKPSVHQSIQASLTSILNGDPLKDYEQEDEEYEFKHGATAIIPISGILGKHLSLIESAFGGIDVDSISLNLDAAIADDSVDTIILYIDSAGGTVTGIYELGEKIARASQSKTVIAYTDSLMASAAYWLGSQATSLYCSTSAELGSIGCYICLLDESEMMQQEGIKINAISAGEYKLAGASFKPLTEDERQMFQDDIDYWYDLFKKAVLSKRTLNDSTMQGQTYSGEKAVELNLADGIIDSIDELMSMTK